MSKKIRTVCIQFGFILLILNVVLNLQAEFYKYVDKEGHIFYVDDLSQVPQEYREKVEVYPEKYDHLPADQKKKTSWKPIENSSRPWSLKDSASWSESCNRPLNRKHQKDNARQNWPKK
jgi:hypothetical protein